MKKTLLQIAILLIASATVKAEKEVLPPDTVPYKVSLVEVEVLSNPKTETPLLYFPGSVSVIDGKFAWQENMNSIKDVSLHVPNLYIPDYGSKLISAIYIRGIGSRINSPAVGLYVDNIPYFDKSSFDFEFQDIAGIEVYRGPQGTLFGRNTMGGLINIYTVSPMDRQGTQAQLEAGSYSSQRARLQHRGKISDKAAYSVGGYYSRHDGYYANTYDGSSCGDEEIAGGNIKLQFRPVRKMEVVLTSQYEYSRQNGYPYKSYDKNSATAGDIAYNDESSYKRHLSTTGINLSYRTSGYVLNAVVGYQYLKDDMRLDQDFTTVRDFTLGQKQEQNSVNAEVTFRSPRPFRNWNWVAGAAGTYTHLNTGAPVVFYDEGLHYMVEKSFNDMYAAMASRPGFGGPPSMTLLLDKTEPFGIDGFYKTPSWNAAAFTSIKYDNLLAEGLSLSAGVRVEYESMRLRHHTKSLRELGGTISAMGVSLPISGNDGSSYIVLDGNETMNTLEVLPRFEIKYKIRGKAMVYALASRGYRAGGYNYQAFSNIVRQEMVRTICKSLPSFVQPLLPSSLTAEPDVASMISYKPEHSWNYEVGAHTEWLGRRLLADLSLFFIDCRDQQISAVEGFGRVTRNSGRTHSFGAELAVAYEPVKDLLLRAAYGYTHAEFKKYEDGTVAYNGNKVPFVPAHTLSVNASYTISLKSGWIDAILVTAGVTGSGRTYWTEANDVWQNFYGLLDADVTFRKKCVDFTVWGKNLTATRYATFYFETMNAVDVTRKSGFMELGRPVTVGGSIKVSF